MLEVLGFLVVVAVWIITQKILTPDDFVLERETLCGFICAAVIFFMNETVPVEILIVVSLTVLIKLLWNR